MAGGQDSPPTWRWACRPSLRHFRVPPRPHPQACGQGRVPGTGPRWRARTAGSPARRPASKTGLDLATDDSCVHGPGVHHIPTNSQTLLLLPLRP